jgi:Arc/MetJ-type ribon-helix-helix transcriptional regulator
MATTISSQTEQLLNQVVSTGRFQNQDEALTEAVRMLYEQTLNGGSESLLSSPEWINSFRAWSRKHRKGNPHMDDSRESIYDDRGA